MTEYVDPGTTTSLPNLEIKIGMPLKHLVDYVPDWGKNVEDTVRRTDDTRKRAEPDGSAKAPFEIGNTQA